jgi:NRAMP (natural resistance-associated macrophage protein)-like metal ion transporter
MKLQIGPGALVAAAFIGPGTVTACTLAGANFGYALIWALVFATVATVILQDMAARLGAGAQLGLGEALLQSTGNGLTKWITVVLILAALAIGNGAYEAGNLTGGGLGVAAIVGNSALDRRWFVLALACIAVAVLVVGKYKLLERILIGLVVVMCVAFVTSALLIRPNIWELLSGLKPSIPEGGLLTAIALIGTTIVPYNLFLHAAAARDKWPGGEGVSAARIDTAVSVSLGGLVSILIMATAAGSLFQTEIEIRNAADMAGAIAPVFGTAARYLVGVGLLAAGLTSAITAPMATGYAVSELFGSSSSKPLLFKIVALAVVVVGGVIGMLDIKPVVLILIAQYANGLLLPIIAVFLIVVMNRKSLLGDHANGLFSNIAGGVVVIITIGLGLRAIAKATGWV